LRYLDGDVERGKQFGDRDGPRDWLIQISPAFDATKANNGLTIVGWRYADQEALSGVARQIGSPAFVRTLPEK
jgi:hypothetical protein